MEKNKKQGYFLPVKGQLISVSEEVYKEFYRITEHGKYLTKKDSNNQLSYYDGWNLERDNGVECFPDTTINVEETVMRHFLAEKLIECLLMLKRDEFEIIYGIYILKQTEAEVAEKLNVSQTLVNRKKKRALLNLRLKLKDFYDFL